MFACLFQISSNFFSYSSPVFHFSLMDLISHSSSWDVFILSHFKANHVPNLSFTIILDFDEKKQQSTARETRRKLPATYESQSKTDCVPRMPQPIVTFSLQFVRQLANLVPKWRLKECSLTFLRVKLVWNYLDNHQPRYFCPHLIGLSNQAMLKTEVPAWMILESNKYNSPLYQEEETVHWYLYVEFKFLAVFRCKYVDNACYGGIEL